MFSDSVLGDQKPDGLDGLNRAIYDLLAKLTATIPASTYIKLIALSASGLVPKIPSAVTDKINTIKTAAGPAAARLILKLRRIPSSVSIFSLS